MAFHSALAKASHNTLASLINDVIVRLNTDVFVETIWDYTPEQAAGDQFADLQHPLRHHGGRPRP